MVQDRQGRKLASFEVGHGRIANSIASDPTGRFLAWIDTARHRQYSDKESVDFRLRIVDISSLEVIENTIYQAFSGNDDVRCVAFSQDGRYLLLCGEESLGVHDLNTHSIVWSREGTSEYASFSPGGMSIFAADYTGTVRCYDARTGQVVRQ